MAVSVQRGTDNQLRWRHSSLHNAVGFGRNEQFQWVVRSAERYATPQDKSHQHRSKTSPAQKHNSFSGLNWNLLISSRFSAPSP